MEIILQYFTGLSDTQINQYAALDELYKTWNEKINVISRKDIDSLYLKHVLHSLSIAKYITFESGSLVADIGTGGGFPGIPLAIFFPEAKFFLIDSIGKKLKVVNDIAMQLNLSNIETRHARAEDISGIKTDYVVSRAVAPLKELWKWGKPLLNKKSNKDDHGMISLKGGDLTQEIYDSGLRPRQSEIENYFKEDFFKDKYLLHIPLS